MNRKLFLTLATFFAVTAAGSGLEVETKAMPIYVSGETGKQIDAGKALLDSVAGKTVLKCQQVVAKLNGSGTGVTFKKK